MSPDKSDDLTEIIERDGRKYVVLRSPATAEHDPSYLELGRFPTQRQAEAFLAAYSPEP
jgi:hypothetical protein